MNNEIIVSSQEVEGKIELGRSRMENSAALIENPIRDGEIGFDKIYILASEIVSDGSNWTIKIDSNDPTVVLDEAKKTEYDLKNSPLVKEIRGGNGEKKLVSGGTWIWIRNSEGKEFLSLLRRDAGAPTDAGCLTGPAGRCGEKLSKTSVDETNQEFVFVMSETEGRHKLLAFYRDEEDKEEVVRQKMRQVGEIYNALMERYEKTGDEESKRDAEFLRDSVRDESCLELIKMEQTSSEDLDTIVTEIDGREVDRVSGLAFMDKKNNTLEVREVVKVELPSGVKISKVIDGEKFLRPTVLISKEDLGTLLDDKLVPALRDYVERVIK